MLEVSKYSCYHKAIYKGLALAKDVVKNSRQAEKKPAVRISSFLLAVGAGVLSGMPAPAQAQTVSCPQSLLFGTFTTCGASNTATVNTSGGRSTTGCLSASGPPPSEALCIVQMPPTFPFQFSFSITNSPVALNNTAGPDTMTVNNFRCFASSVNCNFTRSTFLTSVPIGATLNVQNPQPTGSYSGTFTVNVVVP